MKQLIYCATMQQQSFATTDHLGRMVCAACGEKVEPVVIRRRAPGVGRAA